MSSLSCLLWFFIDNITRLMQCHPKRAGQCYEPLLRLLCRGIWINILRLRQNDCHFAEIFKPIFLYGNFCVLIPISLKFPTLVQIMVPHQSGPSFIKPDQLDPWIKDRIRNALMSTILSLQLPNFVSCGRACPSHRTQNLVTVGTKLLTGEWFSFDPWSMDQADLVW